jgi:Fe-S-cluster-containing hydrogenase component 2
VCGYNCPVGIPVRDFARQGKVVDDARCVQCGQCIEACPRGTLRWNMAPMRGPTNGELSNSDGVLYDELMSVFNQPASEGEGQR